MRPSNILHDIYIFLSQYTQFLLIYQNTQAMAVRLMYLNIIICIIYMQLTAQGQPSDNTK